MKINANIKMPYILYLIIIYVVSIVSATALLLSLFWVNLFNIQDVLFFKSLELMFIVSILTLIILILLKLKIKLFKDLTFRDILLICVIFFTINNIVYGLVPFNASRSVSVMLVGHLYHQQQSISKADLDSYINKKYFIDEDAVGRRLDEQIRIGNVEFDGSGYRLTKRGVEIVRIMGAVTSLYNTEKNYAK